MPEQINVQKQKAQGTFKNGQVVQTSQSTEYVKGLR